MLSCDLSREPFGIDPAGPVATSDPDPANMQESPVLVDREATDPVRAHVVAAIVTAAVSPCSDPVRGPRRVRQHDLVVEPAGEAGRAAGQPPPKGAVGARQRPGKEASEALARALALVRRVDRECREES
jgi:hypothetical protein